MLTSEFLQQLDEIVNRFNFNTQNDGDYNISESKLILYSDWSGVIEIHYKNYKKDEYFVFDTEFIGYESLVNAVNILMTVSNNIPLLDWITFIEEQCE